MTETVTTPQLPPWATLRDMRGRAQPALPIVDVDADAMYAAYLEEYRTLYADPRRWPGEWLVPAPADAKAGSSARPLRPEWEACLADLKAERPSAYWLETCYQSHKLDLQLAMRSFTFEIHTHTSEAGKKRYAQRHAPDPTVPKGGPADYHGRGAEYAAGVIRDAKGTPIRRGLEAREHFRRLRGMLPS